MMKVQRPPNIGLARPISRVGIKRSRSGGHLIVLCCSLPARGQYEGEDMVWTWKKLHAGWSLLRDRSRVSLAYSLDSSFDGDALAGILILETEAVRAMRNLSPSSLIFNRNTGEVSDEIGIHKTLAVTWNSFLGNV